MDLDYEKPKINHIVGGSNMILCPDFLADFDFIFHKSKT